GLMMIDKFSITGGLMASTSLIALSVAVTIMASALKKISDLNPEQLKTGIIGLAGVVGALSVGIIAISKLGGKMQVGSLQLIALATSILILTSAVEKMSTIKSSSLIKSVGALGLIFAQ